MKESYVELLVERKSSPVMKFLQILTGVLAVVCFMLGWVGMAPVLLLPGIALGVVAYLIYMRANIEYEYLYVDKELTIDIIRAKSKRKTVETYDISNMELLHRQIRRDWLSMITENLRLRIIRLKSRMVSRMQ